MEGERKFRFTVEKVFSLPGRGTVATGRVDEGVISLGSSIGFMRTDGQWTRGTVTGIEVAQKLVEEVQAGQAASLLLEGIKKGQVDPGAVLTNAPAPPVDRVEYPVVTPQPDMEAPSIPSSGKPIHPTSSIWRTALFILVGLLIVLALLYWQQQ
jgi:translation elongation factor EF-Tu-like GTPase